MPSAVNNIFFAVVVFVVVIVVIVAIFVFVDIFVDIVVLIRFSTPLVAVDRR